MKINKNHIKLMECFFHTNYSFKEVSMILSISEYTIRRYLNELYDYYNVNNLEEIKIKLNANWKIELKSLLEINKFDRRNYILLHFLKKDFLNLNKICLCLNVSRRTVSNDLEEIKKILISYNLSCNSLNSKGIQLVGNEINKKMMFKTLLFNLFLERNYLPDIFNFIFSEFNQIIDTKIQNVVKKKLIQKNVINHTYLMLDIEIALYIGIIRNNYNLNLYNLKFEIKNFSNLCKKNNKKLLLTTHLKEFNEVKKFIGFIDAHIGISPNLSEEIYISLVTRFLIINEKNKLNLNEFYLLNKQFLETSKKYYNDFIIILDKYFKNISKKIDSLDKISFFLILKDYLYFKDQLNEETIIVYNTLQLVILNNIIEDLKKKNIFIIKPISIYSLKSYVKNNSVKNIILFEDINLKDFIKLKKNIIVIRIALPMIESNYLEIKEQFFA